MDVIVRVFSVSLITAALGAGLGLFVFGKNPDGGGIALLMGCTGAIIGSSAGTARETVAALRQKSSI